MNIIIPMAGMGTRMRPHTLTVPKPLLAVAGKPIIQRLCEDIVDVCEEPVQEIGFIIGDFGSKVEEQLLDIAEKAGAKGKIYYQKEALGTGHAVLCAAPSLRGKTIVAFADTLFRADFVLDEKQDGIIWTHRVEDPSAFGVVKTDEGGFISGFVEKPKEFVSNQAIIGIYYFKSGEMLHDELQFLVDNNVVKNGEYQLTDALENMRRKGVRFVTRDVQEWMDCGNKNATVDTNRKVLAFSGKTDLPVTLKTENSVVIQPCHVGENVILKNAVIGPYVSLGSNSRIENSVISNSIIGESSTIRFTVLDNTMVGNFALWEGKPVELSLGDYSQIKS
ncbi:MAG: nucleotidyltransferase [Bacteroidetes bacterium]|nr:MAG: nucleotidyltransferase [Bacteroidota bacterium]